MGREPNLNTTTAALDHALTIPTLTYPSTSATYTVEYSIQYVNPRTVGILPTHDGLSVPLESPSVISRHGSMTLQGIYAEICNPW